MPASTGPARNARYEVGGGGCCIPG
jgi:hypothetical protein